MQANLWKPETNASSPHLEPKTCKNSIWNAGMGMRTRTRTRIQIESRRALKINKHDNRPRAACPRRRPSGRPPKSRPASRATRRARSLRWAASCRQPRPPLNRRRPATSEPSVSGRGAPKRAGPGERPASAAQHPAAQLPERPPGAASRRPDSPGQPFGATTISSITITITYSLGISPLATCYMSIYVLSKADLHPPAGPAK